MADRRFGVPRTTAERTARHLSTYGDINLPPRGTGLGAGNILQPLRLARMEECPPEPISFDAANSNWPTSLKADDLFDSNFKLTVNVGAMSQNRGIVLVVLYKDVHYLLGILEDVPPDSVVTLTWIEGQEPTIREFIEAMGGTITETTTISLTWETGYTTDGGSTFCKMDEIPASIYVEVEVPEPELDLLTIAVVGGIIIGVGVIAYAVVKKPAVVRAHAVVKKPAVVRV